MNSILEIIHQIIANLVHKFDLQNNYLDEDDPWSEILTAMAFAVLSQFRTLVLHNYPVHYQFVTPVRKRRKQNLKCGKLPPKEL